MGVGAGEAGRLPGTACSFGAICGHAAAIPAPSAAFCLKTCSSRSTQADIYINIYPYFATRLLKEPVPQWQAGVSSPRGWRPPAPQAAARRREGEFPGGGNAERHGSALGREDGSAAASADRRLGTAKG